jgi:hypothetical protein
VPFKHSTMPQSPRVLLALRAVLWFAAWLAISEYPSAQTDASSSISLPTKLRINGSGWWPTKGDAAREEYVGREACAKCHASIASTQQKTAMARAGSRAADSEILRAHTDLTHKIGPYSYQLITSGQKSVLTVSNDTAPLSEPLLWALGSGHMGQTYLYNQDGNFYESHLSFFTAPQALDITPGHSRSASETLADAAGHLLPAAETHRCFGCHTTASTTKNEFDPDASFAGVTCEACHGPGAKHVALATSGMQDLSEGSILRIAGSIFNPVRLSPVDAVDFCGGCHRTWQDVVGSGLTAVGTFNVRFAPYRLENSRCWKTRDARLTCTACHEPHQDLVQDPDWYDQRCFRCHAKRTGAKRTPDLPGSACPVSTKNCVSCHMPKIEPPNLHSAFTDHWIRVVVRGKPYPN